MGKLKSFVLSPPQDIKSGRSPLIHAVENNSLSMVQLLLQVGRAPALSSPTPPQPPTRSRARTLSPSVPLPGHAAADPTPLTPQQHGANVNAQMYSGSSALHSASGRGLLPLVRTLVRSGADSGLKNCHNDTPLMVARSRRVSAPPAGGRRDGWRQRGRGGLAVTPLLP